MPKHRSNTTFFQRPTTGQKSKIETKLPKHTNIGQTLPFPKCRKKRSQLPLKKKLLQNTAHRRPHSSPQRKGGGCGWLTAQKHNKHQNMSPDCSTKMTSTKTNNYKTKVNNCLSRKCPYNVFFKITFLHTHHRQTFFFHTIPSAHKPTQRFFLQTCPHTNPQNSCRVSGGSSTHCNCWPICAKPDDVWKDRGAALEIMCFIRAPIVEVHTQIQTQAHSGKLQFRQQKTNSRALASLSVVDPCLSASFRRGCPGFGRF